MSDRGNTLLRFGDRYIGIPIVFFLGFFKKRIQLPTSFKDVGVLATAAIGDTILISPVLKDFKEKYSDSNITIFCGSGNFGIFEMVLPGITLVKIPVGNPLKSIIILRKYKFDIFLDFGPWPRVNSLLTFFSNEAYKVGFNSIKQYRHYVYNCAVPHLNSCHEIDNLRRLVSVFKVESKSLPSLGNPEPDEDNPFIVVHMFPSGYKAHYKEWRDENWVTLINGVTEMGINVYLTGSPADIEASNRIFKQCQNQIKITQLAGKTNLKQVGEIVKKAILVVSVNTGIMHMAASYNQRVIALHGPTSPKRWGPLCDRSVNFEATTPGAGCLHLGFEYVKNDTKSLDSIRAESILHSIKSIVFSL